MESKKVDNVNIEMLTSYMDGITIITYRCQHLSDSKWLQLHKGNHQYKSTEIDFPNGCHIMHMKLLNYFYQGFDYFCVFLLTGLM
jgi:hypothetical protein